MSCKAEIIDPNQKLQEEAARLDSAPDATKQSKVTMMSITRHYVSSGDDMLVVKFAIEQSPWFVNKFFKPMAEKTWQRREWEDFSIKSFGEVLEIDEALSRREDAAYPTAIMFRKDKGSKYYNVKGMYWGEL